jgi:7-cyano-7-deazaguanine synthase in queuosine biosynthesis
MANERAILCGNASPADLPFGDANPVRLHMSGAHRNIQLRSDDIESRLSGDIPSEFSDLVEIATYVYCADQAITRGGDDVKTVGANWRRNLFFRIPVRHPDLWSSPEVRDALESTLGFLSEDDYHFEFIELTKGPSLQTYFPFAVGDATPCGVEEVVLFSGGIDSLAGAVQDVILHKRRIALVTHKPTDKLERRRQRLSSFLVQRAQSARPIFIPINIRKAKKLSREYTQRSRSFLYAALGATVAQMFGLSRITFYENGIVSVNLPLSPQVVGSKATRTTHPRVLNGFSQLFSLVAGKSFRVVNPFKWHTKTDVLEVIKAGNCGDLIKFATSCTHTWEITKLHTHCGTCSQCVDRRFAVLAADLEAEDPQEAYKIDLLTGERVEGEPRMMISAYVETASQLTRMTPVDFFSRYGEASRVVRQLEGSPDSTALMLFGLHRKQARQVTQVIDAAIAKHASAIRERKLPATCLLRLVCDTAPGVSRPTVSSSVRRTLATQADNVFRKYGQAWVVRFAGGAEFILLPSKGAAYLQILLSQPGNPVFVTDLAFMVAKHPEKYVLGDAGVGSDRDALSAYRVRAEELQEDLDEARKNNDSVNEAAIRAEMFCLAEQIKKDTGRGGRLRKEVDDRDRVRKAVRAAIRRVVTEIAKYDKRLAEHLKSPTLKCGWNPCYDSRENAEWDTEC